MFCESLNCRLLSVWIISRSSVFNFDIKYKMHVCEVPRMNISTFDLAPSKQLNSINLASVYERWEQRSIPISRNMTSSDTIVLLCIIVKMVQVRVRWKWAIILGHVRCL